MSFTDLTPPATLRDRAWQVTYRLGFRVVRTWWQLRRPGHTGALIAVSLGPKLLLLRCSYRSEWSMPGGGVRPGETPAQAAQRELQEEIGLAAPVIGPAHIVTGVWDGRLDQVHVFPVKLDQPPALRLDNREVTGARFFSPAELANTPVIGPVQAYLQALSGAR